LEAGRDVVAEIGVDGRNNMDVFRYSRNGTEQIYCRLERSSEETGTSEEEIAYRSRLEIEDGGGTSPLHDLEVDGVEE
jgi:hypothetical protein